MTGQKTILAFDFGLRKIGIAVGNNEAKTTLPLGIIYARKEKIPWLDIEKLLEEWKPNLVIVGDPLNMDGSESEMCHKARNFAKRLNGRFSVTVHMVDERLTTFEAKSMTYNKKTAQRVDSFAAEIILKDWMSTN